MIGHIAPHRDMTHSAAWGPAISVAIGATVFSLANWSGTGAAGFLGARNTGGSLRSAMADEIALATELVSREGAPIPDADWWKDTTAQSTSAHGEGTH